MLHAVGVVGVGRDGVARAQVREVSLHVPGGTAAAGGGESDVGRHGCCLAGWLGDCKAEWRGDGISTRCLVKNTFVYFCLLF